MGFDIAITARATRSLNAQRAIHAVRTVAVRGNDRRSGKVQNILGLVEIRDRVEARDRSAAARAANACDAVGRVEDEAIRTRSPGQGIGTLAADQDVVSGPAIERVFPTLAEQIVVSGPGDDGVIAVFATDQDIIADSALECAVPGLRTINRNRCAVRHAGAVDGVIKTPTVAVIVLEGEHAVGAVRRSHIRKVRGIARHRRTDRIIVEQRFFGDVNRCARAAFVGDHAVAARHVRIDDIERDFKLGGIRVTIAVTNRIGEAFLCSRWDVGAIAGQRIGIGTILVEHERAIAAVDLKIARPINRRIGHAVIAGNRRDEQAAIGTRMVVAQDVARLLQIGRVRRNEPNDEFVAVRLIFIGPDRRDDVAIFIDQTANIEGIVLTGDVDGRLAGLDLDNVAILLGVAVIACFGVLEVNLDRSNHYLLAVDIDRETDRQSRRGEAIAADRIVIMREGAEREGLVRVHGHAIERCVIHKAIARC